MPSLQRILTYIALLVAAVSVSVAVYLRSFEDSAVRTDSEISLLTMAAAGSLEVVVLGGTGAIGSVCRPHVVFVSCALRLEDLPSQAMAAAGFPWRRDAGRSVH